MNKAFFVRKEDRNPQWIVVDAAGKTLGRLASSIAMMLRGKTKPDFTPHTDTGDYVVVINAKDVFLSGKKMDQKIYVTYSGWIGGKKEFTPRQAMQKDPAYVITHAVKGMMPKTKLGRQQLRKLLVYPDAQHPHQAQINTQEQRNKLNKSK